MPRRSTALGWEYVATATSPRPSPAPPQRWEDQFGTAWRDPWPATTKVTSPDVTADDSATVSPPANPRKALRVLWSRLSRKTTRPQRVILTLACAILLGTIVALLIPHGAPALTVAQLNHSLPSGQEVTSADIEWVHVPAALVPEHPITSADQFTGRRVVGDVERGELLTTARLSTPQLPAGWRALGLPISGATSWRTGQHVDVVASTEDSSWVLCHDAVIHDTTASNSPGAGHSTSVIVALPEEKAYELAQLDTDAVVTLLLR